MKFSLAVTELNVIFIAVDLGELKEELETANIISKKCCVIGLANCVFVLSHSCKLPCPWNWVAAWSLFHFMMLRFLTYRSMAFATTGHVEIVR